MSAAPGPASSEPAVESLVDDCLRLAFSFLPPAGMRITAGNEIYVLRPNR